MEQQLDIEHRGISEYPDSLKSLLYTLKFIILRITLHTFAAVCLTLRLYALPVIFAYKACARQASPLLRVLSSALNSPARAMRNVYRLYRIISSQPQVVELAESPARSIDDAVSVESILLTRIGVQEYHETLQEVSLGGLSEPPTLIPRTASEFAPETCPKASMSAKRDLHPTLLPILDNAAHSDGCPECASGRLGCVTCTQATHSSSVDTRVPRRTKSDSEFCPAPIADEEHLKIPRPPVKAKKNVKLQKRVARY